MTDTVMVRTPSGDEVPLAVDYGADSAALRAVSPGGWPAAAGGGLRSRWVTVSPDGQRLRQRRVVAGSRTERDELERQLDGEICAGLRLSRRFVPYDYPRMLPQLVGYQVDVAEPFVLWRPAAPGRPVRDIARRLLTDHVDQLVADVFSGLACLADAGVVHRQIGPDTVLWTGENAVIDNLSAAALVDEPRTALGSAPWASPEQCAGLGAVEPGDDVWSAVALLGYLLSPPPAPHAWSPQHTDLGPRYGALLQDALVARAGARPAAREVLSRLGLEPPRNQRQLPDAALVAGRRWFDKDLAAKRAREQASTGPQDRLPPGRPRRPHRRRWWSSPPPPVPPAPRTDPPPTPPRARRCYLCLELVWWDENELYQWADGDFVPIPAAELRDEARRAFALRHAYRRCPNPDPTNRHYLPVDYLRSGSPINVALVGQTNAGKSNLLAGMVRAIEQGGLASVGIQHDAMDIVRHDLFRRTTVDRLYEDAKVLDNTPPESEADFADGLVLTIHGTRRPLVFFDVSGQLLLPRNLTRRATQFLSIVDALLFVVDAGPGIGQGEDDPTFAGVLTSLAHRQGQGGLLDIPAAIVMAKSDRVRFHEPMDRWMRLRGRGQLRLDSERILAESRDVYAYLHASGHEEMLAPFRRCRRCTLHFVSATGAESVGGVFPHGARPQRCLEPLLSLLNLTGALEEAGVGGGP